MQAGAGANGRAVALREPVTAEDVLAEPGIDVPPDLRERIVQAGVRAVCAVPLIVRDTVIGVLEVGDAMGRQFTVEEVHLAQSFADHAALSLENARLYAELAARVLEIEASQEQLLQAGKLAAVGQLVSGVAHEINNPLAVIVGQAQLLSRRVVDPDHVQRVDRIRTSAMQAAKIVRELQTFVRPRPREVTPVDLRDVIARILVLREDALRVSGIALVREIAASVPLVRGDASQLEQVLLNLVLNAEQALAGSPGGAHRRSPPRATRDGCEWPSRTPDPGSRRRPAPHLRAVLLDESRWGRGRGSGSRSATASCRVTEGA